MPLPSGAARQLNASEDPAGREAWHRNFYISVSVHHAGGACFSLRHIGAGPRPLLHTGNQPRCHGVELDVAHNALMLLVVADPVIVGFMLPEGGAASTECLVGLASRIALIHCVIRGAVARGASSTCTWLGITTKAANSYKCSWRSPRRSVDTTNEAIPGCFSHTGPAAAASSIASRSRNT